MIVSASKLNVRTGPGEDHLKIGQLYENDAVDVLDADGDWAWIEPPGGWVARRYLRDSDALATPSGLDAIKALFGEPGSPACSAGRVHLPAPIKLGWENATVTIVRCHILLEKVFERVFAEIYGAGNWALLRTQDGIYEDRPISGGKKRSTHAWGISDDLNAATNRQGTEGDMPPEIIAPFEKHGFYWGGRFSGKRRDPMHFQFATGY